MKYVVSFIGLGVLLLLAVTLGVNNDGVVSFNYLIAQHELHLSSLIALLFGVGFLCGWLSAGYYYLKLAIKNKMLHKKIAKLEKSSQL